MSFALGKSDRLVCCAFMSGEPLNFVRGESVGDQSIRMEDRSRDGDGLQCDYRSLYFGLSSKTGFQQPHRVPRNQANIERKRQEEELKKERYLLASALRAEIMALTWEVTKSVQWATTMAVLLRGARGQWTGGVKIPSRAMKTPVFDANVSKLGLLGASVAGDVIAVLAKVRADTSINDPKDVLDNKVVANYYEGLSKSFEAMYEEMMRISTRLECIENSKIEDPGSVSQIYIRRIPREVGIEKPIEWQQYSHSRQSSAHQEP